MVLYFAYGSNMDEKQMRKRMKDEMGWCCSDYLVGNCKLIGRGVLKGYALKFNKSASGPREGYANIVPEEGSVVEGIVFEVDDNGMKRLDCREGVSSSNYYQKLLPIETEKGEKKCEAYIACQGQVKEGLKPTEAYLKKLLAGKQYLSEEYYSKLSKTEKID